MASHLVQIYTSRINESGGRHLAAHDTYVTAITVAREMENGTHMSNTHVRKTMD
jgi:hypothetical protein